MNKEEFNRVSTARSANQIWQTLQVTHEGTNKVKESKISILIHRFELFKMKENETISEMVTRFTDIINSLVALGKKYTQVEKVRRFSVHSHQIGRKKNYCNRRNKWPLNNVISLISNLMAHEVLLEDRKKDGQQLRSKKKVLAFHTFSYMDNSDDDEEEMAMLS